MIYDMILLEQTDQFTIILTHYMFHFWSMLICFMKVLIVLEL